MAKGPSGWDTSLVDPTARLADGLLIKSAGGRTGPLALENGAKLTFPWARQQKLASTKPGEIWVRDGADAVSARDKETLFVIAPDVNDRDDIDRAKLQLDGLFDNSYYGAAQLAAGKADATGLQPRVIVGTLGGTTATTGQISLETVALRTSGAAADGTVFIGGITTVMTVATTTPDTTATAANPLEIKAMPLGPGPTPGNKLSFGHKWIQGLNYNGGSFIKGDLAIQPIVAKTIVGAVGSGLESRMRLMDLGVGNPSVTQDTAPLEIGSYSGFGGVDFQIAFGYSGIQARNGNAAGTLYLNANGGAVVIGSFDTSILNTAWTSYTPTISQPSSITKTVTRSAYFKIGRLVIFQFNLALTAGGTGGNSITITLPVTAATAGGNQDVGRCYLYNGATNLSMIAYTNSTTTITLFRGDIDAGAGAYTTALASGNAVTGTIIYESAA